MPSKKEKDHMDKVASFGDLPILKSFLFARNTTE